MSEPRFIDLNIDGIHIKYLSPDGNSLSKEALANIKKDLHEYIGKLPKTCPKCGSHAINEITETIYCCNSCDYEDLDVFFY